MVPRRCRGEGEVHGDQEPAHSHRLGVSRAEPGPLLAGARRHTCLDVLSHTQHTCMYSHMYSYMCAHASSLGLLSSRGLRTEAGDMATLCPVGCPSLGHDRLPAEWRTSSNWTDGVRPSLTHPPGVLCSPLARPRTLGVLLQPLRPPSTPPDRALPLGGKGLRGPPPLSLCVSLRLQHDSRD